jgi:hypothetical protein
MNYFRRSNTRVAVTNDEPLPVTGRGGDAVPASTLTITTGAAVQVVFAANPYRRAFNFTNTSDTTMNIAFGADPTAAASIPVAAGASLRLSGEECPTDEIRVLCATTGKTFYAYQIGAAPA